MSRASAAWLHHQPFPPRNRAGKKTGKVTGLLVTMDRREHELDRPLGGKPFSFQRIGKAETTNCDVGTGGAATIKLLVHVLTFAEHDIGRQQRNLLRHMLGMQVRGADLDQFHTEFARSKPGKRQLKLRIRKEKQAFSAKRLAVRLKSLLGAGAGSGSHSINLVSRHIEMISGCLQPKRGSFGTERERGKQCLGATLG